MRDAENASLAALMWLSSIKNKSVIIIWRQKYRWVTFRFWRNIAYIFQGRRRGRNRFSSIKNRKGKQKWKDWWLGRFWLWSDTWSVKIA